MCVFVSWPLIAASNLQTCNLVAPACWWSLYPEFKFPSARHTAATRPPWTLVPPAPQMEPNESFRLAPNWTRLASFSASCQASPLRDDTWIWLEKAAKLGAAFRLDEHTSPLTGWPQQLGFSRLTTKLDASLRDQSQLLWRRLRADFLPLFLAPNSPRAAPEWRPPSRSEAFSLRCLAHLSSFAPNPNAAMVIVSDE